MKSIITILVLLTTTCLLNAQDGATTIGLKVGIISPSLYGADVDSISNGGSATSRMGITAGIIINSRLTKYFWLKHEIMYSGRTMNVQLKDSIHPSYNSTYARQYIDIFPVSPSFHYKGLQVYAGPYLGLLLQASIDRKDAKGNLATDHSIYGYGMQMGKQHQKFDAGLVAGIEYEFPFGLNIGAKYVKGFIPVIDYANGYTNNDPHTVMHVYNSYMSVTLGYSFKKRDKKPAPPATKP